MFYHYREHQTVRHEKLQISAVVYRDLTYGLMKKMVYFHFQDQNEVSSKCF